MFSKRTDLSSVKITIMRHGETTWNSPRKRIQGQSPNPDIVLSPDSIDGTQKTLSILKRPDVLICSPLKRCLQTAELWWGCPFDYIPAEKYLYEELKEVNAGLLEGSYVDELAGDNAEIWRQWKEKPKDFLGFPEGETLAEMQQRVLLAFATICKEHRQETQQVCIITHGGPMSIVNCFLLGKDLSHLWDISFNNLDRIELTLNDINKLIDYQDQNQAKICP
jgi:broad specificity phosphatase PhoE